MPVYVLFTKADLLAGFTEFFDDLDRDERAQVWGMTFPLGKPDAGHRRRAFARGVRALVGPAERSGCSTACRPSATRSGARGSRCSPPSSPAWSRR